MKNLLKRLQTKVSRLSSETQARYIQSFVNAIRLIWEIIRFIRLGGYDGPAHPLPV